MKTIIRLVIVSLMMVIAAPAYSESFSTFLKCEQDDEASSQDLQAVASKPVAYAELPGAQHAFEIFHSVRTDHTVNAVGHFLEHSHARWLEQH